MMMIPMLLRWVGRVATVFRVIKSFTQIDEEQTCPFQHPITFTAHHPKCPTYKPSGLLDRLIVHFSAFSQANVSTETATDGIVEGTLHVYTRTLRDLILIHKTGPISLEVLEEGRQFGETHASTSEQADDGNPVSSVHPNPSQSYQFQTNKVYWIGIVTFLLIQLGVYTWIKLYNGNPTSTGPFSPSPIPGRPMQQTIG
jgi:hypothetical protein